MRLLASLLALLVTLGLARGEEMRNVPALGAKLTYRMVITTKTQSGTTTTGEVYTYIVTRSGATWADGVIRPVATILHCNLHCKGGAGCRGASEARGAFFDGDLLTIPIAADAADALAKQGQFRYEFLLQQLRKFPVPGPRDPNHPDFTDIGPDPMFVVSNTLHCDLAGLPGFLPIGTTPQIVLPCETAFERTASSDGRFPAETGRDRISFEINYTGNGWVTLPSGNWEVKKLAYKMIPADPTHAASEGANLFSPQLGISVRNHYIGNNPSAHSSVEATIELISAAP